MGWDGISCMLICLGTFSGIDKVDSALRQEREPPDDLAALLLPEPQGVQIRILHHEA